jgi:myo-inositol-1(or 4)-monophosphatase
MSPRLAFALSAVEKAGKLTLPYFYEGTEVLYKMDESPLTQADLAAERSIRLDLESKFPGESILGEEEGQTGNSEDRWVLDPIDGTKSFVCQVPLFSTLLSYEQAGVPQLGIAHFPALGLVLYTEKGMATYANNTICKVSNREELGKSTIAVGGHRSIISAGRWLGFERLVQSCMTTRTWGDAYGHALVAMGKIEAMIDPVVKRWDVSAMKIIVQNAGGQQTNFSGDENLTGDERLEAVSSNGKIHDRVLAAFK